jgi:hypothetical protein
MPCFSTLTGLRVKDCVLCERSSNKLDYIFCGTSYLLWAHLEADSITIQGKICFYCNGLLRRRYKGHTVNQLVLKLQHEHDRKKFDGLLKEAIAKFGGDVSALASDNFAPSDGRLARQVNHRDVASEIFELRGHLIYPAAVFKADHGQEGSEQGHILKDWQTPEGIVHGYRVLDHGRRPLLEGVVVVRREVRREAEYSTTVDDGSDIVDKSQMKDAFKHQADQIFSEAAKDAKRLATTEEKEFRRGDRRP